MNIKWSVFVQIECAETPQRRTVPIIFPLILQTIADVYRKGGDVNRLIID